MGAILDRLDRQYADIGGYRTHYVVMGEGPSVLLVHGQAPSSSLGVIWGPTIPRLAAAGFKVFAFDQVGFGYSAHPAEYTIWPRLEHTKAFIEAMGLDRYSMWTASDAGYIAASIALEDQRVEKLIIMANATVSPRAPGDNEGDLRARAAERADFHPTPEGVRARLLHSIMDPAAVTDELVEEAYAVSTGQNFEAIVGRQKAKRPPAIYDDLWKLQARVLVLWGDEDGGGAGRGEALAEKIPGSELHIFHQSGQWPQWDHPDRTLTLATEFLRS